MSRHDLRYLPHNPGTTEGFYNNSWRYIVDYDAAIRELPPPGGAPRKAASAMY